MGLFHTHKHAVWLKTHIHTPTHTQTDPDKVLCIYNVRWLRNPTAHPAPGCEKVSKTASQQKKTTRINFQGQMWDKAYRAVCVCVSEWVCVCVCVSEWVSVCVHVCSAGWSLGKVRSSEMVLPRMVLPLLELVLRLASQSSSHEETNINT